jgi:hypothetical protein
MKIADFRWKMEFIWYLLTHKDVGLVGSFNAFLIKKHKPITLDDLFPREADPVKGNYYEDAAYVSHDPKTVHRRSMQDDAPWYCVPLVHTIPKEHQEIILKYARV